MFLQGDKQKDSDEGELSNMANDLIERTFIVLQLPKTKAVSDRSSNDSSNQGRNAPRASNKF